MAKEQIKPMSNLRFDFTKSLDNLCNEALVTLQTINLILKNVELKPEIKEIVQKQHDKLRKALLED